MIMMQMHYLVVELVRGSHISAESTCPSAGIGRTFRPCIISDMGRESGRDSIGPGRPSDAFNDLVLALYQLPQEYGSADFQVRALERVRDVVDFDSAFWALMGDIKGAPEFLHCCLVDQPESMITDYAEVAHFDEVSHRNRAAPRESLVTSIDGLPSCAGGPWRDYVDKYGIRHILSTYVPDAPLSGLHQVVYLWRSCSDRPFLERERRLKQALMPHLVEALRQSRRLEIQRGLLRSWEKKHSTALVDREGVLHHVEERFLSLLVRHWPGWRGAKLPKELVDRLLVDGSWEYHTRTGRIRCAPLGESYLLVGSEVDELASLSKRELQIAEHFAAGFTYRQVAVQLSISPATVRNHIAHVYQKLGIRSKPELGRVLDDNEVGPG